jgi:excisionase family DNA binding protein
VTREHKSMRKGSAPSPASPKSGGRGLKVTAARAAQAPLGSPPQLLTVVEVAGLLRVEVSTIYVWTSKRRIPFRKVGGRLRFDRDEILRWTVPET